MEWEQTESNDPMTLEQMDQLVKQMKEARAKYEAAKKLSGDAYKELEDIENKVVASLKAAGKSKYNVDGIGTVSWYVKESFTTPKVNEDKTRLFNYIKEKYGPDVLMSMVSIHSATLNSFANKETENGVMEIPGLAAPTGTEILSFRKE